MVVELFSSSMGDERGTETTIKLRRGNAALWNVRDPVLHKGEPGVENDTGNFKIGDGVTPWADLPYYVNQDTISAQIAAAIAGLAGGGGGTGGITQEELQLHIQAESPHPVYDDGTSFFLRYENAKV